MHLHCRDVSFAYSAEPLLNKINFEVPSCSHLWIKGRSGSGKSSFLKLLAGLLQPQSGSIQYTTEDGLTTKLNLLSPKEQDEFRRQNIGFLHQENHLIGHWTIEQNLNLAKYTSVHKTDLSAKQLLMELGLNLNSLNLQNHDLHGLDTQDSPKSDDSNKVSREKKQYFHFGQKLTSELSGGERQRVSLARLLLQKPKIALLDEPTSHLDDETAEQVMNLIAKYLKDTTTLIVSHDQRLKQYFSSPVAFHDLQSTKKQTAASPPASLQKKSANFGEQA